MAYTLQKIQQAVGGELAGNRDEPIQGVNALELARPGELAFAEHDRYLPKVRLTKASAVIVPKRFPSVADKNLLRVENPRASFIKAMYLFQPPAASHEPVHRTAAVAPDAHLGEGVTIKEYAVVRSRARIGAGTLIESGAHVGEGASIGERCLIGPNVVIMRDCHLGDRVILHGGVVIGADGFGYVWVDGRHLKIPQLGNVLIEDDVELGANVCVDRATFGSTLIKRGTKVDNLVQIAHNDVIGEHGIMSGQVGLAGSVTVGDRVMMGGQAGVADHLTIGDDVRVGAGTKVFKPIRSGESFWGFPGRPLQEMLKQAASVAALPKWLAKFKELAARVQALEDRTATTAKRPRTHGTRRSR